MKLYSILFASIMFVLICAAHAFAWSSVIETQGFATHQFINRHAYEGLEDHPAFKYSHFPSLDSIQDYSGMYLNQTGAGPDVEGNSKFSEHWYNPANKQGRAPYAVQALHDKLRVEMSKPGISPAMKEGHAAKWAAYGAHFLQDMTCPMHVSGMESRNLDRTVKGSPADNSPYSPVYTESEWQILVDRFNRYSNSGPMLDYFDPLYFDGFLSSSFAGWTDIGSTKIGTHVLYEFQVETMYHKSNMHEHVIWEAYQNAGYLPRGYDNGQSMSGLAMAAAGLTRARIGTKTNPGPLWSTRNELPPGVSNAMDLVQYVLVNDTIEVPYEDWWRAVQLTYVYWRSTFSALHIKKEHIKLSGIRDLPDFYQLAVQVSNLEPMKSSVDNIRVGYEINGRISARGEAEYLWAIQESSETGWMDVGPPIHIPDVSALSGTILFDIRGRYSKRIPDSGIKQIEYDLKDVTIQPVSEVVAPVEAVVNNSPDREDKEAPVRPPVVEKKEDSPKDGYTIQAITLETVAVVKENKTYAKIKDIDAIAIIVRMRGEDSIVEGYNALVLLVEKGYVFSVAGIGFVTSEACADFMVEGIDMPKVEKAEPVDEGKLKPPADNGMLDSKSIAGKYACLFWKTGCEFMPDKDLKKQWEIDQQKKESDNMQKDCTRDINKKIQDDSGFIVRVDGETVSVAFSSGLGFQSTISGIPKQPFSGNTISWYKALRKNRTEVFYKKADVSFSRDGDQIKMTGTCELFTHFSLDYKNYKVSYRFEGYKK